MTDELPFGPTPGVRFNDARILIVDDHANNIDVLAQILRRAGFNSVIGITDSAQALATIRALQPDLVCLDLVMPGMDGFEVLEAMGPELAASPYLPVLVLSADITPEARRRALASGARDFVGKPFDAVEVLLRIRNLLETRSLYQTLQRHAESLEQQVRERTAQLSSTQERIAEELNGSVVRGIFTASLAMQGVRQVTTERRVLERIEAAIEEMDAAIRQVRAAVFGLRDGSKPSNGATTYATHAPAG
ncbi:MAG TPA: response regulator [Mycobacteriales bacterium]|nr:response regulator [Mycobacteriales bacterium]